MEGGGRRVAVVRHHSELNSDRRAKAIIVFSGPICAGKSSVARAVAQTLKAGIVTARAILVEQLGDRKPTRRRLQELGSKLETDTAGAWIVPAEQDAPDSAVLVLDAARTRAQIEAIRLAFDDVFHCHITATMLSRQKRFQDKLEDLPEDLSFPQVSADPIESSVDQLAEVSDLQLDSTNVSTADLAKEMIRSWRDRPRKSSAH